MHVVKVRLSADLFVPYSLQITRPDTPRFIRIVSASNQQTIFTFDTSSATDVRFPIIDTTVEIQLPSGLPAGGTYQVSFDRGAIETNDFCGVENEPTTIPLVSIGIGGKMQFIGAVILLS